MTAPAGRSPGSVALGTFLVLAACALILVIAAGDRAPLWMIGAWFVLALAAALLVGALVPTDRRRSRTDRQERNPSADPSGDVD